MNCAWIRRRWLGLTALSALLLLSACAPRTYLKIDYALPVPSKKLQGQTVRIEIKDLRADRQIFTPAAEPQFKYFMNRYELAVTEGRRKVPLAFEDLQGLFREAFKLHLKQLGATVVASKDHSAPLLRILLQEVRIDLQDHKWKAKIRYEADLLVGNRLAARETVSGAAERVRIIGSGGADEALSDILTDVVNRLNIVKLFQRAKLF